MVCAYVCGMLETEVWYHHTVLRSQYDIYSDFYNEVGILDLHWISVLFTTNYAVTFLRDS